METVVEYVGALPVIALSGRLDATATAAFDGEMAALFAEPRPRILLDLSGLTYISSAGLRSILVLLKHTASHGGRLSLTGASPQIRDIIEISGFSSLMDIYPDRATALAKIKA